MKTTLVPSETFTDRSELGVDLMMIKPKVAGLAKRTIHAIFMQESLELKHFEAIATNISAVRSAIVTWRRRFNTALIHVEERSRKDTMDFGKRYELLGISLIIKTVLSRLLCSIVSNDRALLEEEVQNLAVELKSVQGSLEHNRRAEFYLHKRGRLPMQRSLRIYTLRMCWTAGTLLSVGGWRNVLRLWEESAATEKHAVIE